MVTIWTKKASPNIYLGIALLCAHVALGAARVKRNDESKTEPTLGTHVIYVSPKPGSSNLTPGTTIIVRIDGELDATSISQSGLFAVEGSLSGAHNGNTTVTDDHRTLLFKPAAPFSVGEQVSVSLSHSLVTTNGDSVQLNRYSFSISGTDLNSDKALIARIEYGGPKPPVLFSQARSSVAQANSLSREGGIKVQSGSFPADLPPLTVAKSDSPTSGFIFLATNLNSAFNANYGNYLIIADNTGNPVFYRSTGVQPADDFNVQPTGVVTYYTPYGNGMHYIMNTSLQVIDSVSCANGYVTDGHEMRILPNGNYVLLGDDYEPMDMSTIVPGGNPHAIVICMVIQELDKNKNVIFQWRSIDHFNIADAIGQNLDSSVVDPVHSNAIEIDPDGNILLSSRHLSEITKIDGETGEILWRLGGKNNQFTFVNDAIGFSYQHDIRRLSNGDITLMDNGNWHTPPFSRAIEYKLDEVEKIATLVWQFRHSPDVFDPFMGSVQRLPNGNTIIGWGGAATPAITEVKPDGNTALELNLPADSAWSYRTYRYPFLFVTSPTKDNTILAGDSITIGWTSSGVSSVDIDYSMDGGNSWSNIAANYPANAGFTRFLVPVDGGSSLQFRVTQAGVVNRGMTYYGDTLMLKSNVSSVQPATKPFTYSLSSNYPNPFNPTTIINYQLAASGHVTLKVFDILGRLVSTLVDDTKGPGEYSVQFDGIKFASGVYFYQLRANNFISTQKMMMVK